MIDLIENDSQAELVHALRNFLEREFPVSRLRSMTANVGAGDARRWSDLAGMGCFGASQPETHGGLGLTLAEDVLVSRELGRCMLSPSALATIVAATDLRRNAGNDKLEKLVTGRRRASIGWASRARNNNKKDHRGNRQFTIVDGGEDDVLLVLEGDDLFMVDRASLTDIAVLPCVDETISLVTATIPDSIPGSHIDGNDAIRLLTLLSAANLIGLAEAARDEAVQQAKTRQQFGQPIGTFQAIKHTCADVATQVEAAWSQVVYACLALMRADADATQQVLSAKITGHAAAMQAARANIQIHGGLGFTAESSAHLYLKRAHVINFVGIPAATCVERLIVD